MKEYKIQIKIDENAGISIDAHGFTGNLCLTEIEKILDEMAQDMEITKKPEFDKKVQAKDVNTINVG